MKKGGIRKVVCASCSALGHTTWDCKKQEREMVKKKERILAARAARREPEQTLWRAARKQWIKLNPPDENGYYACHYCGDTLSNNIWKLSDSIFKLTLDHQHPRKSIVGEVLVYDLGNLLPCCEYDNKLKKDLSYNTFCRRYYPHLLQEVPKVFGGFLLGDIRSDESNASEDLHREHDDGQGNLINLLPLDV